MREAKAIRHGRFGVDVNSISVALEVEMSQNNANDSLGDAACVIRVGIPAGFFGSRAAVRVRAASFPAE